ncbi:MAG: family 1 glycosylhydrolase, partial [Bacteroidota bacterium]
FRDYSDLVTRRYGDRVKNWMVLNEPMAFTALGYLLGIHAPGRRGPYKVLAATHHASMCQAVGGRVIRANVPDAHIGTTISASYMTPKDDRPKHVAAAERGDALFNRLFLEPALGLGYPIKKLPFLKRMGKYIKDGDEAKLAFDFDFIGLQNYTREVVKKSIVPFIRASLIKPKKRGISPEDVTLMGWEVYPEAIYELLKSFGAYPQIKKLIVTENGAAFKDVLRDGRVADGKRLKFIQNYLGQVLKAKQEGVKVDGYFVWTFMDNFEWAEGYHPRFGLVHIDWESKKRTIKDSGLWYRDFLGAK